MQQIVVDQSWRDRVAEMIAATRENRLIVGITAAVVAISLLVWGRSTPARIAPPARTTSAATLATPSPFDVVVHVDGAVRNPGLYRFPVGARIADAIETAGGALRISDLGALNLAELLVDGVKVTVPRTGERDRAASVPVATTTASALVSLNTADAAALESIPGIGPVTATAILEHRDRVGAFASVDELIDVDGIGPATLEAIRPYLTL